MTDLTSSTTPDGGAVQQPKKPLPTYRPDYFRKQGKIWLVVSLLILALWFIMWLFMQSPTTPNKKPQETAAASVLDVSNLPSRIESMDEAKNLVSPISFDTAVRDLNSYPPEFKGKSFFNQNKNKWSVTVMDVAEHEVIVNYLTHRSDRDKFAYFRYTDKSNGQTRYLLTYGVMSSFTEAMGVSRNADMFGLPSSVKVYPEEMKRYLGMIDNYERASEVIDLASSGIKEIDLQETTQAVPPEPAKPKPDTPKTEQKEEQPKTSGQNKANDLPVPPTAIPVDNPPAQSNAQQQNRQRNETQKSDNGEKNNMPVTQATPQRQAERQSPQEQPKSLPVNNAPPPNMAPSNKSEQIQSTQSDDTY